MMKIFKLALATFVLLGMGSCQKEVMDEGAPRDGKALYQINLGIQDLVGENTRVLSDQTTSAKGGITNVDYAKYDLRYIISVYDKDGQKVIVQPITKTLDSYAPTTFNFRLTPNRTYKFVVWADFVEHGKTEDLHYDTHDLKNITCKDAADKQLNDESRDAFTKVQDETLGSTGSNINIVLRRPFAKVRVITTDWNTTEGPANEMPDNFKITYYGAKRFNNYNAITTESNSVQLGDLSTNPTVYTREIAIDKDTKYYKIGYDMTPANRTLTVDYLMTDIKDQTPIHLKFEAYDGNTKVSEYDFKNNVPIQRNYLTTLLGNLLTVNTQVTVSIDENFIDEYNDLKYWFNLQGFDPEEPQTHMEGEKKVYEIRTREELMYVAAHPEILKENPVYKLYNDIDMNGVEWMPIGKRDGFYGGDNSTFDGQGHTIRNFNINKWLWYQDHKIPKINIHLFYSNSQVGVFGVWYGDIKNLTIENVTINGMDGSPVGTKTSTWFTGGAVGYFTGNMTNVHTKHVFIKSLDSHKQNIGGLIGYTQGDGVIDNCSATDIHIRGSQQGGLIGSWQGNYTVKNCSTDYIYLRLTYKGQKDLGLFIADAVEGTGKKIEHCKLPTHYEIVNDKTGEPMMDSYKPLEILKGYVGSCRTNADKIEITE